LSFVLWAMGRTWEKAGESAAKIWSGPCFVFDGAGHVRGRRTFGFEF